MTTAFVDTQYLIAIFQRSDQWHSPAVALEQTIEHYNFVTTDCVLAEVLNYFCAFGEETRREVSAFVHDILTDSKFIVIEQSREIFLDGLRLYESRLDKGYSLTDCISMNVCREMKISDILTHDNHFTQEGFNILL